MAFVFFNAVIRQLRCKARVEISTLSLYSGHMKKYRKEKKNLRKYLLPPLNVLLSCSADETFHLCQYVVSRTVELSNVNKLSFLAFTSSVYGNDFSAGIEKEREKNRNYVPNVKKKFEKLKQAN